jgi:ADP-heptose:LPS heptosyltransferase
LPARVEPGSTALAVGGLSRPPACLVVHCRYGIGDVAMSLPALRAARRAAGKARVVWVAAEPAADLVTLVRQPRDQVLTHRRLGLTHWGDEGTPATRDAIERWLATLPMDTLHLGVLHSPVALRRIVTHGTHHWRHEDVRVQDQAGRVGAGPSIAVGRSARAGWDLDVRPEDYDPVRVPQEWDDRAATWLCERGLSDSSYFVASVTASSELKVPSLDRIAGLLDHTLRKWDRDLLLVAGPERERASRVLRSMRYAYRVRLVGREPLLLTLGLLARAQALVSGDTGMLQMAALVDTPTVGIFGPTRARFYAPAGEANGGGRHLAVEPRDPPVCPMRQPIRFGPPACTVAQRCPLGIRSCIDTVPLRDMARGLGRLEAV